MITYRRDPAAVLAQIPKNSAGQRLTRQDLRILFPVRFVERELAELGDTVKVIGMLCWVLPDGSYSVMNAMGRFTFKPKRISKVEFDEVEYYCMEFDANSVVMPSTEIVRDNTVIYPLLDEFLFRGKVPWYFEYDDLLKLFDTAKSLADSSTGEVPETLEAITAIIARNPRNRKQLLRHVLDGKSYKSKDGVAWVPLASVQYGVTSPLGKIAGGYFNDGVVSALVSPSDTVSSVEKVLR